MSMYRTIKALVIDYIHQTKGVVDYEILTKKVKNQFPDSRWKKSHWSYWRTQIVAGCVKEQFTKEELKNLSSSYNTRSVAIPPQESPSETFPMQRGPKPKDPEVKRLGDEILKHIRFVVSLAANDDPGLRFKLNRWVFSRLLQDEMRLKRPVKRELWNAGMMTCQACGQKFSTIKNMEIHRKDTSAGYSVENCEMLCRECHQELGRKS